MQKKENAERKYRKEHLAKIKNKKRNFWNQDLILNLTNVLVCAQISAFHSH